MRWVWALGLACGCTNEVGVGDLDPDSEGTSEGTEAPWGDCGGPLQCGECLDFDAAVTLLQSFKRPSGGNACPNGMRLMWTPGCTECGYSGEFSYYDVKGSLLARLVWGNDFEACEEWRNGVWGGPPVPFSECDAFPVTVPETCWDPETFVAEDCLFHDDDLVYPAL